MWVNDHAVTNFSLLTSGEQDMEMLGQHSRRTVDVFPSVLVRIVVSIHLSTHVGFIFPCFNLASQLMGTPSSNNCSCCPLNLLSWSELLSLDPQWLTCLSYNEEQRTLCLNLLPNNVSESLTTTARPHLYATSFPISRRRSSCLSSPLFSHQLAMPK